MTPGYVGQRERKQNNVLFLPISADTVEYAEVQHFLFVSFCVNCHPPVGLKELLPSDLIRFA